MPLKEYSFNFFYIGAINVFSGDVFLLLMLGGYGVSVLMNIYVKLTKSRYQ